MALGAPFRNSPPPELGGGLQGPPSPPPRSRHRKCCEAPCSSVKTLAFGVLLLLHGGLFVGGGGAGNGRPVDRGVWTAKTVKRPRQQPAHPQYANYWAPLTRKRHIPPHPAQPRHTNHWAPRTRKRHQQEHRPQRPTERSDPTHHAKGRTGDCPGPRKETTTRRNVTQGGAVEVSNTPPSRRGGGGVGRGAPGPLPPDPQVSFFREPRPKGPSWEKTNFAIGKF